MPLLMQYIKYSYCFLLIKDFLLSKIIILIV